MKNLYVAALLSAAALPLGATAFAAPAATTPSAAAQPAAPAAATAAPASGAVAVGATVYDSQGVSVGTIESISGGNVVLAIGESRATLASSAFATGAKGVTINTTKAQLEAAVAQASAKNSASLDSALAVGADVQSKDGVVVGKVKSVAGDEVVLDRPAGAVTLAKQFFTSGASGLTIALSAAELEAAAKAATAPAG